MGAKGYDDSNRERRTVSPSLGPLFPTFASFVGSFSRAVGTPIRGIVREGAGGRSHTPFPFFATHRSTGFILHLSYLC